MRLPPLLRSTLSSRPGPGGPLGSFTPHCRKVVFEYCESGASSKGTRDALERNAVTLAQRYPTTELVLRQRPNHHPIVRGFYGRKLAGGGIAARRRTEYGGNQSTSGPGSGRRSGAPGGGGTRRRNPRVHAVEAGGEENVRGVWSALHAKRSRS